MGGYAPPGTQIPVHAIDVLIVQANTNTLAAHFISLCGGRLCRTAAVYYKSYAPHVVAT